MHLTHDMAWIVDENGNTVWIGFDNIAPKSFYVLDVRISLPSGLLAHFSCPRSMNA